MAAGFAGMRPPPRFGMPPPTQPQRRLLRCFEDGKPHSWPEVAPMARCDTYRVLVNLRLLGYVRRVEGSRNGQHEITQDGRNALARCRL